MTKNSVFLDSVVGRAEKIGVPEQAYAAQCESGGVRVIYGRYKYLSPIYGLW